MLSFPNKTLLVGLILTYILAPTWAIFFAETTCDTVCHYTLRVNSSDVVASSHLYIALSSFDHTLTSIVIKDADGAEKEVPVDRQYGMHVLSLENISSTVSILINTPVVFPTSNILTGVVCLRDASSDQVVCDFLPVIEIPTLYYHAYISNSSSSSQSNAELSLHIALPFCLPDETKGAAYALTIANNDIFVVLAKESQCSTGATSSGVPALSCPFHTMFPFVTSAQENSLCATTSSFKTATNTAFPYELYLPLHSYSHYRASLAASMPLLELSLPVTDATPLQTLLDTILLEAHATIDATNPNRFLLSPRLPSSPPSALPPLPPAATTTTPITMRPDAIDWRATSLPALDVFVRGLFGIEAEDVVYESISRLKPPPRTVINNVVIQNTAHSISTQRLEPQRSDAQRLAAKQRRYVAQRTSAKQHIPSPHLSNASNTITHPLNPAFGGLEWPGVAAGALPSVVLVAGEQGFRARDHLQLLLSVSVQSSDIFLSQHASCVPTPPNAATCAVTTTVPLNEEGLSVFAVYSAVFERDEEVHVDIKHSIPLPVNVLLPLSMASTSVVDSSMLSAFSSSTATTSIVTGTSAGNSLALTPIASSKVTLTPSFEAFAGVILSLVSGGVSVDPVTNEAFINPYSQGALFSFASTTTSLLDNQLIKVEVGCLLEPVSVLSANDGPCTHIANRVYSCSFNHYFSDTLYNLPYSFHVSPFISHEDIDYRKSPAVIKRVLRSSPSIVLEQFDAHVHGSRYFFFETRNTAIHVGAQNTTIYSHLHVVGDAPRLFYPSVDRIVINTTIPIFENALHNHLTVTGTFIPLISQTRNENPRSSDEDAWIPDSAPEAQIPLDCYGFSPNTLVCVLTTESNAQHGQVSIVLARHNTLRDMPPALPLSMGVYTGVTVQECGGYAPLSRDTATDNTSTMGTGDVLKDSASRLPLPNSPPGSTISTSASASVPFTTQASDIAAARAHVRRLARDSVARQQRSAARPLSDEDPVLPSDWVVAHRVSMDAIPVVFVDPSSSTNGGGSWATQASVVWVWPVFSVLLLAAGIYALYRRRVKSTASVRVVDAAKCGIEMEEVPSGMMSGVVPSIITGAGVTVIEMGAVTRNNSSTICGSYPSVDRADVSRSLASITAVAVAAEAVVSPERGRTGEMSQSRASGVRVRVAPAQLDTLEAGAHTRSVALTADTPLSPPVAIAPSVCSSSSAAAPAMSIMDVESVRTVIQPLRVPSGPDSITPLPSDGVRVSARTTAHPSACVSPFSTSGQSCAALPRVADVEVVQDESEAIFAASITSDVLTPDGLLPSASPYHAIATPRQPLPSGYAASVYSDHLPVYSDHLPVAHARLQAPVAVVAAHTPWTYARSVASCPGGNSVGLDTSSVCSSDALSHYAFSIASSTPSTAFPEQSAYATTPRVYRKDPTRTLLHPPAATATTTTATPATTTATATAAALGVVPATANAAVMATTYGEAYHTTPVFTDQALLLCPGAMGAEVMDAAFLDALLMNTSATGTGTVSTLLLDAEAMETATVLSPPPLSSVASVLRHTYSSLTHSPISLEDHPLAATSLPVATAAMAPFMVAASPIMAEKHFPPPMLAAPIPADDYAEPIAVPRALPLSVPTAFASHNTLDLDTPYSPYTPYANPYANHGQPLFSPQFSLGFAMAPSPSLHIPTAPVVPHGSAGLVDAGLVDAGLVDAGLVDVDAWTTGVYTYTDGNPHTGGNREYSGGGHGDIPRDQAPVSSQRSRDGAPTATATTTATNAHTATSPLDTTSSRDGSSGRVYSALEPYTQSLFTPSASQEDTSAPPSQRVNMSLDEHTTATPSTTSPLASQHTASSNNTVLMPQSPLTHDSFGNQKKKTVNVESFGRNECFRDSPSSSDREPVSPSSHMVAQPFTVTSAFPAADIVTPLYSAAHHGNPTHTYADGTLYDPRRLVDYKDLLAPSLLPPPVPQRIYVTQAPQPMLVLPPAPYRICDMVYHPMAPHRTVLLHNVALRVLPHLAPYKYPIYPRTPRPIKAVFALCPEPPLPVVASQNPDAIVSAEPYVGIIDGNDVIPSPPPSLLDSLSGILSYRSMKTSFTCMSDASLRSEIRQVMGQDFMHEYRDEREREIQRPPTLYHNPLHPPPEACMQRVPVHPLQPEVHRMGYRQRSGAFPSPPRGIDLEETNPIEHARYAEWLGISGYELYGCQAQPPPNTHAVRVVSPQQPLDQID